MSDLKTKEDYLRDYHDKLLDALQGAYNAVNRNFVGAYATSFLVGAFQLQLVREITVFGVTMDAGGSDLLVFSSVAVCLLYILINFQLLRMAGIYQQITTNGGELLQINKDAKIFTLREIHVLGTGISGLILSLSRWQIMRLVRARPLPETVEIHLPHFLSSVLGILAERAGIFRYVIAGVQGFLNVIGKLASIFRYVIAGVQWLLNVIVRILTLAALFFLPVIVFSYYLGSLINFSQPLTEIPLFLTFCLLLVVAVGTAVSALVLFASYFVEFFEIIKKDVSEVAEQTLVITDSARLGLQAAKALVEFVTKGR